LLVRFQAAFEKTDSDPSQTGYTGTTNYTQQNCTHRVQIYIEIRSVVYENPLKLSGYYMYRLG